MRYWGFLVLKLAAVAGVLWPLWKGVGYLWGAPLTVRGQQMAPFARDLEYTAVVMLFWLVSIGLLYLVLLDQRFRCRSCLRRLRLPVTHGTWNRILVGPPRTDYICPFGHGTLRIAELHVSSSQQPSWDPIDDMWKELEELDARK